jgi:predicted nucleic acid-binding protein
MRRVVDGEILMNYVTLVEIGHYLRTLPRDEFSERMQMILNLSTLNFVELDDAIVRMAMDLLPRYSGKGLGGRDCVIVATMKTYGLKEILTHDRAFAQIGGIHVTDVLPRN